MVLLTNQLEQKVLNENTVLVYPNTPQKLREYQELVVKGFYLANADVKQTANMIRTLVKTRDIFVDEKLNLLVIKDTPAAVRLAERLIAAQDLAEPEVMLEVEVLEVGSNRLLELGMRFPDTLDLEPGRRRRHPRARSSLPEWLEPQLGPGAACASPTRCSCSPLKQQDGAHERARQPAHPRQEQGEGAHPHRRPRAGDHHHRRRHRRLRLGVGELPRRRPQARGRAAGLPRRRGRHQGGAGGEQHRARRSARVGSNTLTYQIGTRNAATTLRLHDGETQVLAGPDQRRGAAQRRPRAGTGRPAGRRPPVLAHQRHAQPHRDRAADHAAPGAHARAPGRGRGRVRRRHRSLDRRAARRVRPAAARRAGAGRDPAADPAAPGAAAARRRRCRARRRPMVPFGGVPPQPPQQ